MKSSEIQKELSRIRELLSILESREHALMVMCRHDFIMLPASKPTQKTYYVCRICDKKSR